MSENHRERKLQRSPRSLSWWTGGGVAAPKNSNNSNPGRRFELESRCFTPPLFSHSSKKTCIRHCISDFFYGLRVGTGTAICHSLAQFTFTYTHIVIHWTEDRIPQNTIGLK